MWGGRGRRGEGQDERPSKRPPWPDRGFCEQNTEEQFEELGGRGELGAGEGRQPASPPARAASSRAASGPLTLLTEQLWLNSGTGSPTTSPP